ncbi:hypothetical protein V6N12_056941 [Hibiscus sabdariffa]|uniref:Endonuclease/exonuclease/phosphatase domain-containing protein n=1 Tax=Hibiscus sabdariffa TaxID=183260 RepID=A0ABR2DCJ5_9ROSI
MWSDLLYDFLELSGLSSRRPDRRLSESKLRPAAWRVTVNGEARVLERCQRGFGSQADRFEALYPSPHFPLLVDFPFRGLGNKETVRALKNSIKKFQPDIVFLSETKQSKRYLEKIRMKMKLEHSFYIDPIGTAGGFALWWSKDTQINVLMHEKHYIDNEFFCKNGEPVWFGDSNIVSSQEEKLGGLSFNPNEVRGFFDFIDTMGLLDILISGGTFTWSNQRSDDESILEKLDWVLCSPDWNITFPKVVAMLDIAIGSDHAPIIVLLKAQTSAPVWKQASEN